MGLLLEGPSEEEESTTSAEPSLFTRTGIAWPSGAIACFLVLTVGVPLDCEISRVVGESSKGGGECPVWVGVDIAGRTVTVVGPTARSSRLRLITCLLYTSDAADD